MLLLVLAKKRIRGGNSMSQQYRKYSCHHLDENNIDFISETWGWRGQSDDVLNDGSRISV